MEQKDMTNEQFAAAVEKRCEFNHEGTTMTDLRRRLNEADALRKENEELRRDAARLDWIESYQDSTQFGSRPHPISHLYTGKLIRPYIDNQISESARFAKESEASHD